MPLHFYLIQNLWLQEKRENILNISKTRERGLEVLKDFFLPPVKPYWADLDLTDAGPGVGVSNYELRFRDDEMARISDSDYRVRCHRSRGDSGQALKDSEILQQRQFEACLYMITKI